MSASNAKFNASTQAPTKVQNKENSNLPKTIMYHHVSCIVVFMDHAHNIKFFPKITLNFVQFSLLAAI